jgi:hypothetical protein
MTEQETQSNLNGQIEQTEPQQATSPEQMGQQEQQGPADGPVQPNPRRVAGRRPLFRSD